MGHPNTPQPNTDQRPPIAIRWLLLLLAGITAGAVIWAVPNEQSDLSARAVEALEASGIPLSLEVNGRDIALSGAVSSATDVDAAESLVFNLRGVRTVELVGVQVAPPSRTPATFEIDYDGTRVTLRGRLADTATVDSLIDAAGGRWGATNVVSEITVGADTESPRWVQALPTIITYLDGWRSGTMAASSKGIVVTGVVDTETVGEQLAEIVANATELDVSYDLDVLANRPPSFEATASATSVLLNGELPTQNDIDLVVTRTAAAYDTVDTHLTVSTVATAPWIPLLPDFFDLMGDWPLWQVRIDGGTGQFSGLAPSTSAETSVRLGFLTRLGIEWEGFDLEVESTALAAELTESVSGTIIFETASAQLDGESQHVLDGVTDTLLANPSTALVVEGHTDNQGAEAQNLRLSQERAQAVVDYLVSAGIDAGRLTAVGYGETRPMVENDTSFGRAQNRRIEFIVQTEGDQG